MTVKLAAEYETKVEHQAFVCSIIQSLVIHSCFERERSACHADGRAFELPVLSRASIYHTRIFEFCNRRARD